MKVLLVSSSPRKEKSNTFVLALSALEGLSDEGVSPEIIHLSDHHISFCQHCEECHKKILYCSVNDSAPLILNKMMEADGIILASPNYINQVTASMKALFDRSTHFIHCRRLLGKYVAAVVTSGSGQDKEVLNYIRYYANVCGAQYSGGISSPAHIVREKKEEAYQLGRKMFQDIKEREVFADQMQIIEAAKEYFMKVLQLRKEEWKEEYNYWREKGWLE